MQLIQSKSLLTKRFQKLSEKRQGAIIERTRTLALGLDSRAKQLFNELREIRNIPIKNRADLQRVYADFQKLTDKRKRLKFQLERATKNAGKHFVDFKPLQGGRSLTSNNIELQMHKAYQRSRSLDSFMQSFEQELYMHQSKVIEREKAERRW